MEKTAEATVESSGEISGGSPVYGQNQDYGKTAGASKLTVGQYLNRAPQDAGIGELVRALYKTKILSFEEWETTVKALLKKQVR